jgi:hypothetical protein
VRLAWTYFTDATQSTLLERVISSGAEKVVKQLWSLGYKKHLFSQQYIKAYERWWLNKVKN